MVSSNTDNLFIYCFLDTNCKYSNIFCLNKIIHQKLGYPSYIHTSEHIEGGLHLGNIQIYLVFRSICTTFAPKISQSMNIEALISKAAGEAVKALYGMDATEKMLQLQKTRSEFEGNLTLVVFPFVKAAKKSPEQTAQEIGEYMTEHCTAVEKFNVVKGFLNLSIGDGAWLQLLEAIDKDEHFGTKQATESSPLVMIEYSSPNTNKPLHLGHVRNNLLGWSLA